MLTRRIILLGGPCAAFATAALADDQSARAFVEAIYAKYKGKNTKGVPLDSDEDIRRWFEPSLATLMIKDRTDAEKRKEPPALDGDPFVGAQDWEIASFDIAVTDIPPDKATATVNFTNDTPVIVILDLIKIKNEWKISDITWKMDGDTSTLRSLFAV
jgi:hypothetical protein